MTIQAVNLIHTGLFREEKKNIVKKVDTEDKIPPRFQHF